MQVTANFDYDNRNVNVLDSERIPSIISGTMHRGSECAQRKKITKIGSNPIKNECRNFKLSTELKSKSKNNHAICPKLYPTFS